MLKLEKILSKLVKPVSKVEKLQAMVFLQFLVLLGMENNLLKVYQNPPIKKSLNSGSKNGDFRLLIGMNNNICPQQNYCLGKASK